MKIYQYPFEKRGKEQKKDFKLQSAAFANEYVRLNVMGYQPNTIMFGEKRTNLQCRKFIIFLLEVISGSINMRDNFNWHQQSSSLNFKLYFWSQLGFEPQRRIFRSAIKPIMDYVATITVDVADHLNPPSTFNSACLLSRKAKRPNW